MKGNMRKAFSHIVIPSGAEGSLPFAVRDSRVPHMCLALLRFPHLSFIPLEPYPARYARHLPHAGKALSVVILFPHMRVFALRLWGKATIRDMLFFHLFSCPPGCFCFLPSHSPVFPCARKISRCARNDEGREDSDTGKDILSFGSPTFSAKRSHSLRKEHLRNHHFPPILSAFSHREAPRGSLMDFFKNKRVSPHFLQI